LRVGDSSHRLREKELALREKKNVHEVEGGTRTLRGKIRVKGKHWNRRHGFPRNGDLFVKKGGGCEEGVFREKKQRDGGPREELSKAFIRLKEKTKNKTQGFQKKNTG